MFDDDTLIVTYDEERGEPRGSRSRKAEVNIKELGSCIDCSLCVQVCPTGIDIRKGLQYECIGCGACADVCDTVMDKMGYARGLVKYSTQNAITNKWTHKQMVQRILRPRVLIYTAILGLIIIGLITSLWLRTHFRVDVIRDRGVMARLSDDGKLENVYRLQIMNGTESVQHYRLSATGIKDLEIESEAVTEGDESDYKKHNNTIMVNPTESRWLIVDLKIPDGSLESGSHKIEFQIEAVESKEMVTEKSVFLVPR
jgi:cytochrome c oxidase accessory protein FixG